MNKEEFLRLAEHAFEQSRFTAEGLFLYHLFGFTFEYDDEKKICRLECKISDPMLNSFKIVHGGILAYIADTAMGHLNIRYKDSPCVSLELKTSYFKPAIQGNLIALARYAKEGKNVFFTECKIFDEKMDEVSMTTATFFMRVLR